MKKKILACCMTALLAASTVVGSNLMPAFAAEAAEAVTRAGISTSMSINAPTFTYDTDSYLYAVKYEWTAGYGGDRIAFSRYSPDANFTTTLTEDGHYTEIAFADLSTSDKTYCKPEYYYYRTYNTSTGKYSYEYRTVEHDVQVGEGQFEVRYGYNCLFTPKAVLTYIGLDNVPTSLDQTGYIWEHDAGSADTIIATLRYNDTCCNLYVQIPWIGWRSSFVTIDGVQFELRTGPNKCSIAVNRSGVSRGDVDFAFGTIPDSQLSYYQSIVNFV